MQSNCAQEGKDIWWSSSSLSHTQEANKSSLANMEHQYGRTVRNKTGNLAQSHVVEDFD